MKCMLWSQLLYAEMTFVLADIDEVKLTGRKRQYLIKRGECHLEGRDRSTTSTAAQCIIADTGDSPCLFSENRSVPPRRKAVA